MLINLLDLSPLVLIGTQKMLCRQQSHTITRHIVWDSICDSLVHCIAWSVHCVKKLAEYSLESGLWPSLAIQSWILH